jgi:NAD-dependent deacetylase
LWTENATIAPLQAADITLRQSAVWDFFRKMHDVVATALPNPAHHALTAAESTYPNISFTLITQNIDGLHQVAGSKNVVELHGSLARLACSACPFATFDPAGRHWTSPTAPACPECQRVMRPGVVLFDEPIPVDAERSAKHALRDCDLFIAVGTSGTVSPASNFVRSAEYAGARTVLVNLEPMSPANPAFQEQYLGPAELILPQLLS